MREYTTDAWVLRKQEQGEYDARLVLFTRELGRVMAKATSVRKITSKLAAHLEPFLRTRVRLVEGKGNGNGTRFQVTDAFREAGAERLDPRAAELLFSLTTEGEVDLALWHAVHDSPHSRTVLGALGFDPTHATCVGCGKGAPSHFSLREAAYYCDACVSLWDRGVCVALSS